MEPMDLAMTFGGILTWIHSNRVTFLFLYMRRTEAPVGLHSVLLARFTSAQCEKGNQDIFLCFIIGTKCFIFLMQLDLQKDT